MTKVFLTALALVFILLGSGCQSLPALRESRAWHGQTPVYATYRFGVLHTELPPGVPIETVNAAAKSVLYRQGHTIEEASVSPGGGRIVALAPRDLPYDRVKVNTSFEGGGVLMSINIDPADESRSRIVLESILQVLGL